MLTESPFPVATARHYSDEEIKARVEACPKLGSVPSVVARFQTLVQSEGGLNFDIASLIRCDPTLSARLLRLVNTVYFGLSTHINDIEEAVSLLGDRQIRELAMTTPPLDKEDCLRLHPPLPWREFWSHCVATAMLTRDIIAATPLEVDDDTDYLVGLLHDIGKIVMAYVFPDELQTLMTLFASSPAESCTLERQVIGWDHAQIGSHFLAHHHFSEEITLAVRHHHEPERAPRHRQFAAAIQVADYMVRSRELGTSFDQVTSIADDAWLGLPAWKLLFGIDTSSWAGPRATLANSLRRLPSIMRGVIESKDY